MLKVINPRHGSHWRIFAICQLCSGQPLLVESKYSHPAHESVSRMNPWNCSALQSVFYRWECAFAEWGVSSHRMLLLPFTDKDRREGLGGGGGELSERLICKLENVISFRLLLLLSWCFYSVRKETSCSCSSIRLWRSLSYFSFSLFSPVFFLWKLCLVQGKLHSSPSFSAVLLTCLTNRSLNKYLGDIMER